MEEWVMISCPQDTCRVPELNRVAATSNSMEDNVNGGHFFKYRKKAFCTPALWVIAPVWKIEVSGATDFNYSGPVIF